MNVDTAELSHFGVDGEPLDEERVVVHNCVVLEVVEIRV
jgi:hypothetical protein